MRNSRRACVWLYFAWSPHHPSKMEAKLAVRTTNGSQIVAIQKKFKSFSPHIRLVISNSIKNTLARKIHTIWAKSQISPPFAPGWGLKRPNLSSQYNTASILVARAGACSSKPCLRHTRTRVLPHGGRGRRVVPAADAHSIRPCPQQAMRSSPHRSGLLPLEPVMGWAKNNTRRSKEQTRSDSEWCPSCRNFGGPAELTVRHGKNFA